MKLPHLCNIFKIYHAEKSIANAFTTAAPSPADTPSTRISKSSMVYHLYKLTGAGLTQEQKFQHAVTVRNRTLGEKATVVSPYLNVEVSADNNRFLRLKPDDVYI